MTEEVRLMDDPAERNWHLDKRLPVALILAIIVQTVGFGVWMGNMDATVRLLGDQVRVLQTTNERLTRVEVRMDGALVTLDRIDGRLERMEDRQR